VANTITKTQARRLWLHAQKLDEREPFGSGPEATQAAVEHLGYVQIDTINVIERCHHHILYNRIPKYQREDLHHAQTRAKSVFEYWTHALSYVPSKDFRYFLRDMNKRPQSPWFKSVGKADLQRVIRTIKNDGPLSIRDFTDDVLVPKEHLWASPKPSKKALQLGFYSGRLTVSERVGMLKKYQLIERHFDWKTKPKPATEKEVLNYMIDRALKAQALVTLDSICHLHASKKPAVAREIEKRVRAKELIAVQIRGLEKPQFWMHPDSVPSTENDLVHILSPFDPLIIQRKRLQALFDYQHIFEAYLPKVRRTFGYFALPVLIDDRIVAAIDLKTDRAEGKLLVQQWTWIAGKSKTLKKKIEDELHRFEKFQLC
jgi:uncharacterized protein YcaQ